MTALLQLRPPEALGPWPTLAFVLAAAVGGALVVHAVAYGVLARVPPARLPLRGHLVERTRQPTRWVLLLLALEVVAARLPDPLPAVLQPALGTALYLALVVAVAWLLMRAVAAVRRALRDRLDLDKADNLTERRVLTQIGLFQRLINVGIVVIAVGAMLLHFESVRRVGTGLLASAGVAGIVLGFAAQRVLGNLFAGIQIAITQPIRVDDVVVVEGEWAKVEDITLTYVVVRIWDLRRLVLPISYFIETPFQNWTRRSAQVLGTVYIRTDFDVPVEAVRAALGEIVEGSEFFDGEVWRLHVTDLTERGVEMRGLMSAANADHAWELRCEVREKLLAWLRATYPDALPRTRLVFPDGLDDGRPEGDPPLAPSSTEEGGRRPGPPSR